MSDSYSNFDISWVNTSLSESLSKRNALQDTEKKLFKNYKTFRHSLFSNSP